MSICSHCIKRRQSISETICYLHTEGKTFNILHSVSRRRAGERATLMLNILFTFNAVRLKWHNMVSYKYRIFKTHHIWTFKRKRLEITILCASHDIQVALHVKLFKLCTGSAFVCIHTVDVMERKVCGGTVHPTITAWKHIDIKMHYREKVLWNKITKVQWSFKCITERKCFVIIRMTLEQQSRLPGMCWWWGGRCPGH